MTDLPTENVQSYPRPPALEPVTQTLRLAVDGVEVARTDAALRICETHHPPSYYLPPDALAPGLLRDAGGGSWCEWKGRAAYFDVMGGAGPILRGAWAYPAPTARFARLAGHVAFYLSDRVRGWVGDTEATPQPGGFYGGWVTPNLTGRIKGPPGTGHW
jgi:uncharacterized protein (DUF427 family)